MSRPPVVLKLEQLEDVIAPWGGFSNPFKAVKDAVSDAVTTAVQAPAAIVQTVTQSVTQPVKTVAQAVSRPEKPAVQAVKSVGQKVTHAAQAVSKKTEKVAHKAKDAAEGVGKRAEKVGKETKRGAEKVGKAVKDGYSEAEPYLKAAAPIVVGVAVTVVTANPYIGVAAGSVTGSLVSGERDIEDIAVNVAKAEAVAVIGGQVSAQFASASAGTTAVPPLTAVEAVGAAAVTSVVSDVVVNGETDPAVLLEHAAVAGATSYANSEVAKLDLGRPADTVVSTVVNQAVTGHFDSEEIILNSGATLLGTEVGNYLKPVFWGQVEPTVVPESEETINQQNPSTESPSVQGGEPQLVAPADAGEVVVEQAVVPEAPDDPPAVTPPSWVTPSESGLSLHAVPDMGAAEDVDVISVASGLTSPPVAGAGEVVVEQAVITNASDALVAPASGPSWVTPSESGLSLLAVPDVGAAEDVDAISVAPPSGLVSPPALLEPAAPPVVLSAEVVAQNEPRSAKEIWDGDVAHTLLTGLVDAADSIQAAEDAVSRWAVDVNEEYNLTTRASGLYDGVTGYLGTVAAIGAIPVTRGATGLAVIYQADQSAAGFMTAWTGEQQPRFAEQHLSPTLDFGFGMVGPPGRAVKEGVEKLEREIGEDVLTTRVVKEVEELTTNATQQISPLTSIHPESSLSQANLSGLREKSTEDIIESLAPGQLEPLRVYPNGRIGDGNTRIQVLRERGVDVDKLPRITHTRDDSDFPDLND